MRVIPAEIAGSSAASAKGKSHILQRSPVSTESTHSVQSPHGQSGTPSTITSPFSTIESAATSVLPPDILSRLGPSTLIYTIVNDWFEHIHPLAPVLHRRQFLTRLQHGDAISDLVFCGLVISVLCATCATLRRKSFAEYYPITSDRCIQSIQNYGLLSADGPYTPDWCVAKYNLATASMAQKGMSSPWSHRMFNEAMTGTRYLLNYKLEELSTLKQELCKRLHCLLEISVINVDMLGQPVLGRLSVDSIPAQRPQALTDEELDPSMSHASNNIYAWHGDNISYVPGLTNILNIFLSWHICQTDRFYHPPQQVLSSGLLRIQRSIDQLPPELRWRGGLSRPPNATSGHDVQIANLFITSLYVRSNLLQQFGDQSIHQKEHQSIVGDLLEVLYHLPQPILEANGCSLIPKIRDIGGAYLEVLQVCQGGGGLVAIDDEAKARLEGLLKKLGVLDFRPDALPT
ncbi:hypothetical protein BJY04DRAFT_214813 [Aspergillus karnatakaensis]|uniref:fungal specific transcription factor domain-containing protein n=1 Tax=Aspergillus karnatakaensis TaxID=1810916 RepID=UPI003CCD5EF1